MNTLQTRGDLQEIFTGRIPPTLELFHFDPQQPISCISQLARFGAAVGVQESAEVEFLGIVQGSIYYFLLLTWNMSHFIPCSMRPFHL
jgi:hypothetical protein